MCHASEPIVLVSDRRSSMKGYDGSNVVTVSPESELYDLDATTTSSSNGCAASDVSGRTADSTKSQ